jgi:hypothetical protein
LRARWRRAPLNWYASGDIRRGYCRPNRLDDHGCDRLIQGFFERRRFLKTVDRIQFHCPFDRLADVRSDLRIKLVGRLHFFARQALHALQRFFPGQECV